MALSVCSVLQAVDRSLIEAARDLGARPSRAFLAVTFPLSLPGVVAGSIIVFALSVSAYVIPSILSGGREMVTPILIFQQYTATFPPRHRSHPVDRPSGRDAAADRRLSLCLRAPATYDRMRRR